MLVQTAAVKLVNYVRYKDTFNTGERFILKILEAQLLWPTALSYTQVYSKVMVSPQKHGLFHITRDKMALLLY